MPILMPKQSDIFPSFPTLRSHTDRNFDFGLPSVDISELVVDAPVDMR